MGEIYLARREGPANFEKTVVIKRILPHLAREETFIKKFLDEARIVVNLTHSNIVPVFDMGEEDGEYYLAMEYVPGRDLRGILQQLHESGEERLPPPMALRIASETCKALGYAHRRTDDEGENLGIVHRDVSPSNVIVSKEGETKLIDFGVAQAAGRLSKTMSGRIQGKCAYMSPEQAEGAEVDARTDIFSAGVVLYEMLTGQRPFEGDTDLETLRLVRECHFDDPSSVNPDLPPALDDTLAKALAERPEDRYDDIEAFEAELIDLGHQHFDHVRTQDLAEYLAELFPEGYEPPEHREVRTESTPAKDLDEAIEKQLEEAEAKHQQPTAERTATLPSQLDYGDVGLEDGSATDQQKTSAESSSEPEPTFSASAAVIALFVFGLAFGAIAWFQFGSGSGPVQPPPGKLQVTSEPSGATVTIDGKQINTDSGIATTPLTYEVKPGRHTIRLSKSGFKPKSIAVEVDSNKSIELSGDQTRLVKKAPTTHQFQIRARPPGTTVFANQKKLGEVPVNISLTPDEVKNIRLEHKNCDTKNYTLGYGHEQKNLNFTLSCAEKKEQSEPPPEPERSPPPKRQIKITSKPSGSTVSRDDERLGKTPLEAVFRVDQAAELRFDKEGFEVSKKRLSPGELRRQESFSVELEPIPEGCLDFSAVEPQLAKIAIDGEWLPRKRGRLKNYKLTAGKHEITVKNEVANKPPETHTVQIEPGSNCTLLKIWEPK
jgi:serine/threonine-protein kinase